MCDDNLESYGFSKENAALFRKLGLFLRNAEKENNDTDRYIIDQGKLDAYTKLVEFFQEVKDYYPGLKFLPTKQMPSIGTMDLEIKTSSGTFSINGEEMMQKFADAISHCSAFGIDIENDKIHLSFTVPDVFLGLLPEE